MEEKHFWEWIELKERLHFVGNYPPIKEGQIWWCAVGENIGAEINGKNHTFSRPVLIMKKLSQYSFMGIPLTSQPHEGSWYVHFKFKGKMQYAALAQAKAFSVSRLYTKMGTAPNSDLQIVRDGFRKLYC
ncbi:type II toxin-antitoxin system PemK/MazF family toxin [Candidatus Saccharibacteria bacterium]|nr:type II toxin-antitoxin system PemK/MazF family toxin [Candidatus Saccharibacteria bacterium]